MRVRLFFLFVLINLVSCTKREAIFNSDVTDEFELALILKFNDKACLYDSPTNTLWYSLSEADLSDFTPYTEFQEYSEITFNGLPLANKGFNDLGSVSLNTTYSLEIETGDERNKLNLVFTQIPLVQIVTLDKIKNEPKSLAKLSVNYPEASLAAEVSFVGIEQRGRPSKKNLKKSYGFKALQGSDISSQRAISYFNLEPNTKWSLDAMFIDESKVRNKTSYELWNSISDRKIHSQFVEVFINNESLGLYRFSENYTEKSLETNTNSALYTGIHNTEYTKFEITPSNSPNSATWKDWEQEFPDPAQRIYWDDFHELSELITTSEDHMFINEIESLIDIDNVVDYYLFVSLCYAYDNAGKNWFFYKQTPSSKFEILVWDLDATWGRNHHAVVLGSNFFVDNNLFDRLISLNPNDFRLKLKNRWSELRSNQFSNASIKNQFDVNFSLLEEFQIEEKENNIWDTDIDLELEKSYIENWTADRLIFLDNYVNGL